MAVSIDDIKALSKSPIFKNIPVHEREDLLKEVEARVKTLDEGLILRRAGDSLDFYPVVVSGKIQASMPQGGQDRMVAEFGPGESFAEAVPHTLKYTPVNIRAVERSRILCIPAKQLEACMNPNAYVMRENLSTEMSKKVGYLSQALSVVGEPRLSDRILAHVRTLPTDKNGWSTIEMSRGEWAAYLRVAEKSLIRELRALREDGQIEIDGQRVRLLCD